MKNTGSSFSPDFSNLDEFLIGLGKLDDRQRDQLHKDIEEEELADTVKRCDSNRSPGLDGISYELYQQMWHILGKDMLEAMNCQLERKRLIDSNTLGATRLASKVDGIPAVDELRPITLLNCDYKILTKVFVGRMIVIMVFIIKSGQLCSVGKKNILFGVNNIISTMMDVQKRRLQAALLSFDLFKAFDRVFVVFLLKVMKAMNFSEKFCDWIAMLHKGAKTRFILDFLTEEIELSFSIRQGDPLSMLLFIIYVEPLLMYLERKVGGIRVGSIIQTDESYCDDINVMVNNIEDFKIIDDAFKKFEDMSGAILSRNSKSKILALGSWTGKSDWPLAWLKSVSEVKVFGVWLCASYKEIITVNWRFRLQRFEDAVKSWGSRFLDSLSQRIEVLRVFALSRLWYLASALPTKREFVKKVEQVCGRFIWNQSGRILRIKMEELKKPRDEGGLGMPCFSSMCDSLLVRQLLRMLVSEDFKTIGHVRFWMGARLDQMFQLSGGAGAGWFPDHFASMIDLLNEAVSAGIVKEANWKIISNKDIYKFYISLLPKVKVEIESGLDYKPAWKRLVNEVLDPSISDTLLLLIHNKLPTAERLHRIGVRDTSFCLVCPGGIVEDAVHFFCECVRVERAWSWVRSRIVCLLGSSGSSVSNWELLNLFFPRSGFEKEILWLIGVTVQKFWTEIFSRDAVMIKDAAFFGFLSFKYREQCFGNRVRLKMIPGVSD